MLRSPSGKPVAAGGNTIAALGKTNSAVRLNESERGSLLDGESLVRLMENTCRTLVQCTNKALSAWSEDLSLNYSARGDLREAKDFLDKACEHMGELTDKLLQYK